MFKETADISRCHHYLLLTETSIYEALSVGNSFHPSDTLCLYLRHISISTYITWYTAANALDNALRPWWELFQLVSFLLIFIVRCISFS